MSDSDVEVYPAISRRSVLTVGAVGVGTVALAACSKAKEPGASGATTPAGSSTPPASSPAGGAALAKLSDIPVGKSASGKSSSGAEILITRTGDATAVGFSAICTHQGCTVAASFHCPCHGSTYDPKTGARISGPARQNLAPFAVKVSGGDVVEA